MQLVLEQAQIDWDYVCRWKIISLSDALSQRWSLVPWSWRQMMMTIRALVWVLRGRVVVRAGPRS